MSTFQTQARRPIPKSDLRKALEASRGDDLDMRLTIEIDEFGKEYVLDSETSRDFYLGDKVTWQRRDGSYDEARVRGTDGRFIQLDNGTSWPPSSLTVVL